MNGKLVLEDGSCFPGHLLEHDLVSTGEVVFNTGMTGYQEVLTDPSYCGQIVTMTYPLIGNYGVAELFNQSRQPHAAGFVVSQLCSHPSNWQMEHSLASLLRQHRLPCLFGVDTRAVTRRIRSQGTMRGIIAHGEMPLEECLTALKTPGQRDLVSEVSVPDVFQMEGAGPHVVVMDYGIKQNILRSLAKIGCRLTVVPARTTAAAVMALRPDGVFLSNGPGDPKDIPYAVATVAELAEKTPIFGICLGHQILSLAFGGDTYKLKFGHRGANHPVKDLETGRVYITSQNHGYAVREDSLPEELVVTHRSIHDGTVEGLRHRQLPVFSVQYHPEAAPGPDDNTYLFEKFLTLMRRRE